MVKTNVLHIVNRNRKDIILWPNDEKLRDRFAVLIAANTFKILECHPDFIFDIDECYFQFKGMKRKIKHKNLHKYNVDINIGIYQ